MLRRGEMFCIVHFRFDCSSRSDGIKKSMAVKSWIASVNKISNVPQTGTPMVELEGAQQVTPAAALAHKARCGHTICVCVQTHVGVSVPSSCLIIPCQLNLIFALGAVRRAKKQNVPGSFVFLSCLLT